MIGIYKIENLINGKKYIGQSIHIEKRWATEKRDAFNEKKASYHYPLSKAFRKYGIENFSFEIIEECLQEELNDKEKYWVAFYDSFYSGYNQTLGGDSPRNKPKETIIGVIFDLENTNLYHREIAEKWNISQEMVQGINTGRYWFQENKVYPLQKQHKEKSHHIEKGQVLNKPIKTCAKCGKKITAKATLCIDCAHQALQKVERPNAKEVYE